MPWRLRYLMAKDAKFKKGALKIFLDEVFGLLRRLAGAGPKAQCGAMTSVQRFGSALNLNVHFHALVLDGAYDGAIFKRAAPPSPEDLQDLVERVSQKIVKLARRMGYPLDLEEGMGGAAEEPEATLFDTVQAASIRGMLAFPSPQGGLKRVRLLGKRDYEPQPAKKMCAQHRGFSVHAQVRISGNNREGLARVCRYVLRPPFSVERLALDESGHVVYQLRKPRADGATHLIMEPVEFVEKMAALVPPPRVHLVHYHGVLGPNSRWRKRKAEAQEREGKPQGSKKRRRDWAELLQKTFGVDVLGCAKCGGKMKLIAMIKKAATIRKILTSMGYDVDAVEAASDALVPRAGPDPPEAQWNFPQE
jgi:hypothetical protein